MSELTSAQLEEACQRYVSLVGDENVDALIELFADDCTVEDPVGSDARIGKDAVHAFFVTLPDAGVSAELTGPVRAVPDAKTAAFPFAIDSAGFVMQVIDVMTFDDEGRITSMKAYWKM